MLPFRPGTISVFLAVVGAALAAFGIWGILVAAFCALLTVIPMIAEARPRTLIAVALLVLAAVVVVDFGRSCAYAINDWRPWYRCGRINLRQIGRALQKYHAMHSSFPPVHITNDEGEPIHSWRTLILPYLDNDGYDKYNLGESWDSTHNQELADHGAAAFRCPLDKPRNRTTTSYVAVIGPGTAWKANHGCRLKDITDDPSQTVLVVEVLGSNIHWMEPCDITLEQALDGPNNKASVPFSQHIVPGGYFYREIALAGYVLMADGSVVDLAVRPSSTDMAALLSINGNDYVNVQDLTAATPQSGRFHWNHVIGLPLFLAATVWFWLRASRDCAKKHGKNGTKVEGSPGRIERGRI